MSNAVVSPPTELVLGRYRPVRPLGSGGSGSVWLALDETTGLEVALKIVRREGKAEPRAEREAEVAARLRHPRCLRAYAYGRDGRHVYIAYEYAPGRTLREAFRAGALDDRTAVEAAAQVLEALAHAHGRGVVHRDVKPSNVLLVDGEGVDVRLLDFGLAQVAEAEALTASGDVPGTLAYIAPERLTGEPAGPAADVWGVGILLWEALAGTHPFWTASPIAMAKAIEAGAPSLHQQRPDLPRPLLAAVDRALAREPGSRPRPAELASELRRAFSPRVRPAPSREPRHRSISIPKLPRPPRALSRGPTPAVAEALLPAGLAALVAGWSASALPFYPAGWPVGLALFTGLVTSVRPRAGLALALAVPVLPLGNVGLGIAVLYTAVAIGWLALAWREPRSGLFFVLGPLLAPIAALGFLPLAAARLRSPIRRAGVTAAAVLTAAVAAGVRHASLPFTGAAPPLGIGLAGGTRPAAAAEALWGVLASHPELVVEALVLGVAAALVPLLRGRGPWWAAGFGAALLAAALLPAPAVAAFPLVAAAWATCAVLALAPER